MALRVTLHTLKRFRFGKVDDVSDAPRQLFALVGYVLE